MSSYHSRRGPNVSQYLRELNAVQPDVPATKDTFDMEKDLALFTNSQFFDFESGQNTDFQVQPGDVENEHLSNSSPSDLAPSTSPIAELPLDFITDFNFEFPNSYQAPALSAFPDNITVQPLQPSASVYTPNAPQQPAPFTRPAAPRAGEKRKADSGSNGKRPLSFEEASRLAAEEDKRRRNTAASARFRVKKKQREQALEKSAKEVGEKVTILEGRIQQLETENKWLKSMILEKNGGNEQIAALLDRGMNSRDDVDGIKDEFEEAEVVAQEA